MAKVKRIAARRVCYLFLAFLFPAGAHGQVRTIFLVRHADKISNAYDSALSDQGLERAKCLADMLVDSHVEQIFTSDLQRTQQTAGPLVARVNIKPVVIFNGAPDDLVDAIRASKAATILVVWHGGTLPKVLRALGGPEVPAIGDSEYDRFFVLTLADSGDHPRVTFLRYCDRLN